MLQHVTVLLYLLSSNHNSIEWMYDSFYMHSFTDRHCFHSANMNNATINIHMHSFCVDILSVLLGIDLEVESLKCHS